MNKPVRKTPDQLAKLAASKPHRKVRITKPIPSGTLANLANVAANFAAANGVKPEAVRLGSEYYQPKLIVERLETDDERFKRIKAQENARYSDAKWRYDRWVRDEKYRQEQAAAGLNQAVANAKRNKVTIQCECNCKCS